jgi:hypothetical protein
MAEGETCFREIVSDVQVDRRFDPACPARRLHLDNQRLEKRAGRPLRKEAVVVVRGISRKIIGFAPGINHPEENRQCAFARRKSCVQRDSRNCSVAWRAF